jgi:phage tail sheath protein FI
MIQTQYPGVYVTEVATGARPIDGVSTETSALTGPTALERLVHTPHTAEPAGLVAGRTAPSDSELKYVDVRRYVSFLETSIRQGIQFAAFEPNGEALWANVRTVVSDFLYNQWKSGALVGSRPEEAFFVRCDRSTMTQEDIDNGRMDILIGVATTHPAEFVMVRISALTGSASS